ncbi:MAG: FaeA/PapI family transcriptional regulator [Sulfolobales archaeon]
MSLGPIDKTILEFLKKHPNSKPREIADALGFSIVVVRSSLYRLRERGYVARTSKGYIAKTSPERKSVSETHEDKTSREVSENYIRDLTDLRNEVNDIIDRISEIEKTLQDFGETIARLEKQYSEMRVLVKNLQSLYELSHRRTPSDPLISRLLSEKILSMSEARRYASEGLGSLDKYIESGVAVIIGKFVVSKEFYDNIISKLPIEADKLNELSAKEKILIETLINEGYAYIDPNHVIRLLE